MKTELKHLVPYLPYGLKAMITWTPLAHQGVKNIFTREGILDMNTLNHAYENAWMYQTETLNVGEK